ncbi:GNAT family N-acetyltransferase [Phyllobacterium sp. OV277]|uniref:GNAT family N-acetyltransferase n=1 Tax=Phyllobacterium sp. OV277 TaxID=1882772 RepID=UPI00088568EE|nr:GNAT family N-acetyltransferase [Phyllobacterium sp. OV277]SDP06435.1 Protein N-acetyltransferase, RimJ/RimL family [Phyllobacterium sp. OV277]
MRPETPRLRLRQWRAEDRAPFFALNSEPEVYRYLMPLTREGSDAMLDRIDAQFAENGWGFWALEERASGTLIGMCGLADIPWQASFTPAVEIGWRLSTPWHGKGLAREAAEAALAYGFQVLKLDRIVSFTTPANTASWGLMQRLGMQKTGEFDHPSLPKDHPLCRHVLYEITAMQAGESR